MDENERQDCPVVLIKQLEHMIEYADNKRDYVLAAWLSQARERIQDEHVGR